MHTHRALFAAALALCMSAPATRAHEGPHGAPAEFTQVACTELGLSDLGAGAECGRLAVPERRDARDPVMLSLPVVILRATGPARSEDAVLYLHGGPGIATLESAARMVAAPSTRAIRATRDLVMFDQRGTGRATPALCPEFDAELRRIGEQSPPPMEGMRRKRAAAEACRKALLARGVDPASYNSTAIAEDAHALRTALGYRQWNVYATSYGSFPAFELARRHPASVRALLLNSPFPPNSPNRAEQLGATVEGLAALQARCHANDACRDRQPDLLQAAATAIRRLDAAPLKTAQGRVTGATLMRTAWTMLVQGKTAPLVPELLRRAASGDDASVLKAAAPFSGPDTWGTYSHIQNWLVSCHDIYPRPSAALVRAAAARHAALAQELAADEQDVVCDTLQPTHAPPGFYADAPVAIPALVYAGEYDPATPTSDARAAMAMLPRGTLALVTGASHASMGTDACTLGIAERFLADPAQPLDTTCLAARPQPVIADSAAFDAFLATLP